MEAREQAKIQAEKDRLQAIEDRKIRKEDRRQRRIKAKKDEDLNQWKIAVDDKIIYKCAKDQGYVRILDTPLSDVFGDYSTDPQMFALGGNLIQIYYAIEVIYEKYPQGLKMFYEKKTANDDEEYFTRPNNLRELALDVHLMPFLMQYIKEMGSGIDIMIHPKAVEFLKSKELSPDDFKDIKDEDLTTFKEIFRSNLVSPTHKIYQQAAGDQAKIFDQLLDHLIDIKGGRTPECNVKIDQIYEKVKFLAIQEEFGVCIEAGIEKIKEEQEDGSIVEKEVKKEVNTNEAAVIVLQVP